MLPIVKKTKFSSLLNDTQKCRLFISYFTLKKLLQIVTRYFTIKSKCFKILNFTSTYLSVTYVIILLSTKRPRKITTNLKKPQTNTCDATQKTAPFWRYVEACLYSVRVSTATVLKSVPQPSAPLAH